MSGDEKLARSILKSNYSYLVDELDVQYYVNDLFQEDHLHDIDKTTLSSPTAQRRQLAQTFVDMMLRKPDATIEKFFDLVKTKNRQPQIHKKLFPHSAAEVQTTPKTLRRGRKRQSKQAAASSISEENTPTKKSRSCAGPGQGESDESDSSDSDSDTDDSTSDVDGSLNPLQVYPLPHHERAGKVLIINNIHFANCPKRKGASRDGKKTEKVFRSLKFDVDVQTDLNASDMKKAFKTEKADWEKYDEKQYGCFVAVIMTHGNKRGDILGCDGQPVKLSKILKKFSSSRCAGLKGKPKVFLIQACRGDDEQKDGLGQDANIDDLEVADIVKSIPNAADFFVGYATGLGFVAYRHPSTGSRYVKELFNVLSKSKGKTEICEMHTHINARVGTLNRFEKQAPQFVSSLTKKLYLTKAYPN